MKWSVSRLKSVKAGGLRLLLPLVAVLSLSAACSSDECLGNKNALPLAGFYSSTPDPQVISLDSLSVYGIGAPGDSVLHDSVRSLAETYLPFRIDTDSTKYVIKYLQQPLGRLGVADTILFRYDIVPMFVSVACGAMYEYRNVKVTYTTNILDSVTCPSGDITNEAAENIKIYFRVSNEENR